MSFSWTGAAQGAGAGSMLGPWGMLGGGVLGGFFGGGPRKHHSGPKETRTSWRKPMGAPTGGTMGGASLGASPQLAQPQQQQPQLAQLASRWGGGGLGQPGAFGGPAGFGGMGRQKQGGLYGIGQEDEPSPYTRLLMTYGRGGM